MQIRKMFFVTMSAFVLITGLLFIAIPVHADSASEAEKLYVHKSTWPKTMAATRESYQAWYAEEYSERPLTFEPWFSTDPIRSKRFTEAHFPEQGIDITAKNEKGGKRLWAKKADWADGAVIQLPGGDSVVTYLYRRITADRPVQVEAGFGSSDDIQVWLNGKQVLRRRIARPARPNQDMVSLNFKSGENDLLVKVFNRKRTHAFACTIVPDPTPALWARIAQDFPVEMGWASEDMSAGARLAWFRDTDGYRVEKTGHSPRAQRHGKKYGRPRERA